ncbi:MAG: carboxypeptidase-like regulatory domain-containing protein, partial [Bacteroidales bacterium]|nr:carboxypeptidase-like regulatory domain-containing protein [Bacteroidales bacterium]
MGKKILKSVTVFLFLVVFMATARSQGIRGEIRDVNGEVVPYAAIFIKELTRGTTCNALGLFSLPLPEGSYTIFFRSLGYTEVTRTIEVGPEYTNLVIELPPQTYFIPEVRISATGEDPAYWIMRKTIGLANYHLHEVLKYDAEIYIKGTALLEKLPRAIARRIQVNNIRVEEGEAYMLESLNEVQFTAPDKYEMRVIASQNTLPGYTENVNPMDYINTSLYQQQIEGFISPLARNAFTYYRFKFDGTFLEGTYIINKIRVTPKRKSQQICEGYLYIVEDLWCLHSADLSVNTIAGTVTLQQLFANIIMDAWLPVNHKIGVDVDIAGVLASVTYVSSLEYSDVTLNPNLPEIYFSSMNKVEEPDEQPDEQPLSREQEKINELLQKEELTNRDVQRLSKLMEKEAGKTAPDQKGGDMNQTGTTFSVADSAVKNDSLYWNAVRPIPLTPEEHLTLKERDSIIGIQRATSVAGGDSIRTTSHRQRRLRGILMGRTYTMSRGKFRFSHDGLIDLDRLGFNTVDGLSYGQAFRVNWKPDTMLTIRSNLVAEYAFHRNAPMVTWNSDLLYAPLARGKVAIYLNYTSSDFNGSSGIPRFTNMVYSLFLRENYMKKYEQIDATLYNRIDVANGWIVTTSASYGRQNILVNNSDFSFFFRNDREFTANTPGTLAADDPSLADYQKLMGVIRLDFTPKQP